MPDEERPEGDEKVTCRELCDLLSDDLAGEVPARTRAAAALHLLVCGPCRAYRASYRATVDLVRSCDELEADDE
nr:hypothetical protein [Gammaproteobacteria bacterium]